MTELRADEDNKVPSAAAALPEELVVSVPPSSEYNNPDNQARQVKIFCHNCQQKLEVTGLLPFAHINCPSCGGLVNVAPGCAAFCSHCGFKVRLDAEGKIVNDI